MSEIFKICLLDTDRIKEIIVFYGSKKLHDGAEEISPEEYFKMEPRASNFKEIFNDEELEYIEKHNPKIQFIDLSIRLDDTIEDIKRKIIMSLKNTISFDEIYLFAMKEETVDLITSYQNITQNEKLDLTKDRLSQFLLNFKSVDINELEDKEIYDYSDLLTLKFSEKEFVKKPLGQKFFINDLKYQYTVNPFDVIIYDDFLEKYAENIVTTLNRGLLLDFGFPYQNNIYCCLAEDVYNYIEKSSIPNITIGVTAKIYYPFLFKQNIYTSEQLRSNRVSLIANNKSLINKYSEKKMKIDNLIYDLYYYRSENLNIGTEGIKYLDMIIHPPYKYVLPIDVIFKLIHSTKNTPFIKLNPGNRKEKLYRIHTDSISSDGRKIPYLSKATILRLARDIGKNKRLAVYIEYFLNDLIKINIICEFDNQGNIYIKSSFPEPLSIENTEKLLKATVNPVLLTVKEFIEQSGYSLKLFESLIDKNIEIVDINYNMLVSITKNIHLDKYVGCITNSFNIIEDNLKKGIVMRYKRVSNFNLMSSQNALIIELVNKGLSRNDIVNSLSQNFNIDKDEALGKYIKFINEVEIERGLYENKRLKIRDNPGFLTKINIDSFTNNILIEVSSIDNIYYLYTVPKILYSTILLTQNQYNPKYKSDVALLCKRKVKDIITMKDIVAPAEQQFTKQTKAKINDLQELTFEEEEEDDDIEDGDEDYLQQLMGLEDDDEGDDIAGGSSPEGDIQLGDDISIGSSISMSDSDSEDQENDDSQEGNIVTPKTAVTVIPKVPSQEQSSQEIELGDSIEASKSPSQTGEIEMGDDIEASKSPSQTGEIESSPQDIQLGDSIESSKSKLPEKKSITPAIEDEVLPQPKIDLTRGVSLTSQLSSQDSLNTNESSISDASDIGDLESLKKSIDSKDDTKSSILSAVTDASDDDEGDDFERDITGTQLNNPYYFQSRMEKRDPALFEISSNDPKFKAYSRMCPSNVRRQPVILTEKEKAKIDKEHPGSYDHAIKYGSDPNKQFYYICPRYWCLKDNTSLTEEEVEKGVCGGRDAIIPQNASKVPAGKYIYEFNAKREHKNADGSYLQHSPGFLSSKKHPNRLCLPCCFKNWDAPEQKRRRNDCAQNESDKPTKPPPLKRSNSVNVDDYIKDETKFPLESNRWGYLPSILQDFLKVNKKECNSNTANLKPFTECLLRHGVELNKNQSFVACLADLYVYYQKSNVIPTVSEMKRIIINAVDLDIFLNVNNGNLIQIFASDIDDSIDIQNYNTADIYKAIDTSNKEHVEFLKSAIAAYKNFTAYLSDDTVKIDYSYLWDIVCMKNPKLFPAGLNLVIMEIGQQDITNDVKLICPSNHYSRIYYEARKSSFLIMKQGDYYEPIYMYQDMETQVRVHKTFNEYASTLPPNLKIVLSTIKNYINNHCKPLPSMPRVYRFVENNGLDTIISEVLKVSSARIINLVMNYNSKIIGLNAVVDGIKGYVPCYPSGIESIDIPIKFIDDRDIWNNYEQTCGFLALLSKKNSNIRCKPLLKVVDEELVVGVITETNQFIQLIQPEMPINDGLDTVNESNYLLTDKEIILNKEIDNDRLMYVKKIKLEKNFYDVFRNSLRIELNKYENRKIREEIMKLINNQAVDYYKKMESVISILHSILDNIVDFTEYNNEILYEIDRVTTCVTSVDCNKPYCMKSGSGEDCKLLIPQKNLLNGLDNEVVYFARLTDELLRYNRIKLFIFDPKTHLTFGTVNYNLSDNEIILLSSLLTQEYFKDLVPVITNKYITTNTFDTAEPSKSQIYSSVVKDPNELEKIDCKTVIKSQITGKWREWFLPECREVEYPQNHTCTYSIIIDILHNSDASRNINIRSLKILLLKEYKNLFTQYDSEKIYDILQNQGKVNEMRRIKSGLLSFDDYLLSDNYYITNLDIWLIALHFKLGITLISSTSLIENRKNILPLYYPDNDIYYFIRSPGIRPNNIPKYKLITDNELTCDFKLVDLKKKLKTLIIASKTLTGKGFTLDMFIKNFKRVVYKSRKQLKGKLKIVKSVVEDDDKKLEVQPVIKSKKETKKKKATKTKSKLKLV